MPINGNSKNLYDYHHAILFLLLAFLAAPNNSSCDAFSLTSQTRRSRRTITTISPKEQATSLQQSVSNNEPISTGTPTIEEATKTLSTFDMNQLQFIQKDGSKGMGGGTSALAYIQTQLTSQDRQPLRDAILALTHEAHSQRATSQNQQYGRIMLGICAENVSEGLMGLKSWVEALSLPRGLLHGLDVDGEPIEILGSVYLKYNTGGCMTFSEMRKTGKGFDALWRPGDVVLETYDGDFRGIYFNLELDDGEFRQFGVLPTDLFLEEEEW